ncbi:adenylate cyclase type 3 [Sipha flava]|uniref:adenylate cyclase n=1 Tax=Sipha flava TaxID=143950 RepID=A0A2S2Q4R6_9HEMI|nr:adenylate cyclase type 3 [Sipha flava]XP_025417727.1 adenylate cyclase type 3 [Sipha flava]
MEPTGTKSASEPAASTAAPNARRFEDRAIESLYQSYNAKQKRAAFACYVSASVLFDVYCLSVYDARSPWTWTLLAANVTTLLWCRLAGGRRQYWTAVAHLAWLTAVVQVVFHMVVNKAEGADLLGWILLYDYLAYVSLPLTLALCIALSATTCFTYVLTMALLGGHHSYLARQLATNSVLLLASNCLGLLSYFLADKQQRTAFLETRQCLEMKMVIEEQSTEQERLLLSVLPEHVAVKMRQDLGEALDSQFKKIYMSRHENVSILYADIVGFTAISSTYSASDLVKILNELFARFDRLSEKYQQLRIKILGDCYYCISGAPKERPDHAVLSVHMGLSMVKAIKYVQQTTNSPVDMRVGIHTGAVLAGVLGQRQWQFDVYSKDVELANKMESSGMPGRVHISEKTLSFLNGEFEVEPGYGERREEALKMASIKTFFIIKTIKPFKMEVQNGSLNDQISTSKESVCATPIDEADLIAQAKEDSENFKKRLRKDLMNRDGHRDLNKHTKFFTLSFNDEAKEREYKYHKEAASGVSLIGCPLVLFLTSSAQIIMLPRDILSYMSSCFALVLLLIIVIVSVADIFPRILPSKVVWFSETINDSLWIRRILGITAALLLASTNLVGLVSCWSDSQILTNCTHGQSDPSIYCMYPSYFTYFMVLALIATSMLTQLSHFTKATILFVITLIHCIVNTVTVGAAIDCEDSIIYKPFKVLPSKYALSFLLIAVTMALVFLARNMDKSSRVLYLWRTEVEEQRERASDIRRRNEALVYNILPPHVAKHFLGSYKRQHEELYSQSYAEVGVLFASMPNFSDFYSEETVNNQGLECLRFLNEVISDFDALLEQPRYQDIIKIKTIGSTYMAASGLNPSRVVKPEDSIEVRWAHLALLVDFAFDLKKALQGINEQSFNHFVLKMGINHGPITAGVIGARKPHYDIWGNSVNVASRMESTGKAGCIQVTEETCTILQHFGFKFEQRGLVAVKGKGQLMTYYLVGKGLQPSQAPPPIMETLPEVEEEDTDECLVVRQALLPRADYQNGSAASG